MHLSGSEGEDQGARAADAGADVPPGTPSRSGVIRRVVTRRGNLYPKTKNFARIRAALAEEGAPVESEFRREAEVVRQVRENDVGVDAHPVRSADATALSSPNLSARQDDAVAATASSPLDDAPDVDMAMSLSAVLRQRALRNHKARNYWDNFSDTSSSNGNATATGRTTPPTVPLFGSAGEDMTVDQANAANPTDTPRRPPVPATNKRRREEDDLDPVGFKRRAVSPSVSSVHGSPIAQSPLQRDAPWGAVAARAGSTSSSNGGGAKGRVGFQGMVDTSDGLCRMSIE
jgi:hypothetical protein